ncbi:MULTISPECIES: hypothetical protein [unclassified Legionella]|uniref:hypothetical protein n=1 Tax=unclassified Legionella TaxID=2622702 RepID=UPI0010567EC3|nr:MULTISPECIES: hypothetical protein [unclassified Legionella]MDI9818180.1 hypothetical protein [Legionella sp. PL877]
MINFIEHLEGLIASKVALSKGLFTLLKLEARLAGLTVYPLLINLGMLIALCFSTWLTAVFLAGYIIMLFAGMLAAIITVLLVNLLMLFFIIKRLILCLRHMSFEKTRALLHQPKDGYELTQGTTEFH